MILFINPELTLYKTNHKKNNKANLKKQMIKIRKHQFKKKGKKQANIDIPSKPDLIFTTQKL